jgi:hypothetical protein
MKIVKVLQIVGNLFIASFWFWFFNILGWISFDVSIPLWKAFILSALVAWLAQTLFELVYMTFVMVTCCMGCITLPVAMIVQGWVVLWATSYATHWFTINHPFFWIGLLMSIAFGIIRIPDIKFVKTKISGKEEE